MPRFNNIVYGDFETYFDREFSLSKMPTINYCRDPRFKVFGVAVKLNDQPSIYLTHEEFLEWSKSVDWATTAFSAHNCQFDACVLTQHYNIFPAYYMCSQAVSQALLPIDSVALKKVAPLLGLGEKGDALVMGAKTASAGMAEYAIQDNELSYGIIKMLYPMLSQNEQDLVHLHVRMAVEPSLVLDVEVLNQVRDDAFNTRATAIKNSGYSDKELTSNQQFGALVRALGLTPPTKLSDATGEEIDAFGKNSDEFVEFMLQYPEYKHIWDGRLAAKSNINVSRAEKFLSIAALNPLVPMPLKYCGAHCVPGATEVLTREGWKRIDLWDGGYIAQVRPDLSIDFLHATKFTGPKVDTWVRVDSSRVAVDMTHGHTVPYFTDGRQDWATVKAEELLGRASLRIPTTGLLSHEGTITADQMRVLVMLQADGSFSHREGRRTSIRFKFKKQRKIDRARDLLDNIGVVYTERPRQSDGCVTFYIPADAIPGWLREERKVFGPWLLDSTMDARKAFIEEVLHWDGIISAEHRRYSSNNPINAEWVSTICHITNQAAYISEGRNPNGSKQYVVSIKILNPGFTIVQNSQVSEVSAPGLTYCPTTETGFWLARSNGKIFITGNTGRSSGADGLNVQNLPNKYKSNMRKAFTAPKGQVIVVVDSAQIELRVNMWLAGQDDKLNILATGGDIYKVEAATQFNISIEEVTKNQRQYGKLCQLGLGFGMGAKKFRKTAAAGPLGMDPIYMTEDEAYNTVQAYRAGNSKIPQFWRYLDARINQMTLSTCNEVDEHGLTFVYEGIILPSGRMLQYPGLHQTEEGQWVYGIDKKVKFLWGGTMDENLTQAIARDIVFEQKLKIDERYRVVSSTHDEILFSANESEADEALAFGLEVMSNSPTWANIPVSAEGGYDVCYSK